MIIGVAWRHTCSSSTIRTCQALENKKAINFYQSKNKDVLSKALRVRISRRRTWPPQCCPEAHYVLGPDKCPQFPHPACRSGKHGHQTVRTGLGSKACDPSSNAPRTNSACSSDKKYRVCGERNCPRHRQLQNISQSLTTLTLQTEKDWTFDRGMWWHITCPIWFPAFLFPLLESGWCGARPRFPMVIGADPSQEVLQQHPNGLWKKHCSACHNHSTLQWHPAMAARPLPQSWLSLHQSTLQWRPAPCTNLLTNGWYNPLPKLLQTSSATSK